MSTGTTVRKRPSRRGAVQFSSAPPDDTKLNGKADSTTDEEKHVETPHEDNLPVSEDVDKEDDMDGSKEMEMDEVEEDLEGWDTMDGQSAAESEEQDESSSASSEFSQSSIDSAFSMPEAGANNEEYLTLCDETEAAMDAVSSVTQKIVEWKQTMGVLLGLPANIQRRTTVLSSQALRATRRMETLSQQCLQHLRNFSKGLVMSREVRRLEEQIQKRASERDAARLQVMETERKFRAALCQIKFHKNDLAIFRWFRMTSLLQIRQLERNSSKRASKIKSSLEYHKNLSWEMRNKYKFVVNVLETLAQKDARTLASSATVALQNLPKTRQDGLKQALEVLNGLPNLEMPPENAQKHRLVVRPMSRGTSRAGAGRNSPANSSFGQWNSSMQGGESHEQFEPLKEFDQFDDDDVVEVASFGSMSVDDEETENKDTTDMSSKGDDSPRKSFRASAPEKNVKKTKSFAITKKSGTSDAKKPWMGSIKKTHSFSSRSNRRIVPQTGFPKLTAVSTTVNVSVKSKAFEPPPHAVSKQTGHTQATFERSSAQVIDDVSSADVDKHKSQQIPLRGQSHTSPTQTELEEKDRTIGELRRKVKELENHWKANQPLSQSMKMGKPGNTTRSTESLASDLSENIFASSFQHDFQNEAGTTGSTWKAVEPSSNRTASKPGVINFDVSETPQIPDVEGSGSLQASDEIGNRTADESTNDAAKMGTPIERNFLPKKEKTYLSDTQPRDKTGTALEQDASRVRKTFASVKGEPREVDSRTSAEHNVDSYHKSSRTVGEGEGGSSGRLNESRYSSAAPAVMQENQPQYSPEKRTSRQTITIQHSPGENATSERQDRNFISSPSASEGTTNASSIQRSPEANTIGERQTMDSIPNLLASQGGVNSMTGVSEAESQYPPNEYPMKRRVAMDTEERTPSSSHSLTKQSTECSVSKPATQSSTVSGFSHVPSLPFGQSRHASERPNSSEQLRPITNWSTHVLIERSIDKDGETVEQFITGNSSPSRGANKSDACTLNQLLVAKQERSHSILSGEEIVQYPGRSKRSKNPTHWLNNRVTNNDPELSTIQKRRFSFPASISDYSSHERLPEYSFPSSLLNQEVGIPQRDENQWWLDWVETLQRNSQHSSTFTDRRQDNTVVFDEHVEGLPPWIGRERLVADSNIRHPASQRRARTRMEVQNRQQWLNLLRHSLQYVTPFSSDTATFSLNRDSRNIPEGMTLRQHADNSNIQTQRSASPLREVGFDSIGGSKSKRK